MKPAPYAADPARSRGRLHQEPPGGDRGPYERDRDRVIHSTAFRRLKDKTQVFLYDEGDHYRTRLTHTLEVAQIARALARALGLDEDLAEALALAHDLGHPPFGHAGERALAAAMAGHGGFDHNAQSLRVVTALERRYAGFDGLNLTWETLEGLAKHNGPLRDPAGLPPAIADYTRRHDLHLDTFASAEAQAASIADDIAYDAHDIDDGLRAGLLTFDDLADVPLAGGILREVGGAHPHLAPERLRAELVRRVIRAMIEDVVTESRHRLAALAPGTADDIRRANAPVVGFSPAMADADRAIKEVLRRRVYRDASVMEVMDKAGVVVRRLFDHFMNHPDLLPEGWHPPPGEGTARTVADFLAGMTDRYALIAHERFFGTSPDLRHDAV